MGSDSPLCTRKTCRICDTEDLRLVLDYGEMPLAGGFVEAGDPRSERAYPLRLAYCPRCTLLQILDTVSPDLIFSEYSYSSSMNRTLVTHFEELADELMRDNGAKGRRVAEFGCNDGILLGPLQKAGASVVGIDPSDVAARASREQGWPLHNDYFGPASAAAVRDRYGPAHIVVGANVCAHVDDLHALIEGVTTLLDAEGVFICEVHYQGDLLEWTQYDTVYHEHTCYHSLTCLSHLFRRHGLEVVDVRRIPIHAGSIRVTAARVSSRHEPTSAVDAMIEAERKFDPMSFGERVEARRGSLTTLVRNFAAAGKRVVAYGASGRATVLLNFCDLGPDVVEHVSDLSPLRFGKVVPGVRVPVVRRGAFHDDPPDYAILTAWNYEKEIIANEQDWLRAGGRFIVPLPEVRIAGPI